MPSSLLEQVPRMHAAWGLVHLLWWPHTHEFAQAAKAKHHTLGGLSSRNLCLTVLEAGRQDQDINRDLS